MPPIQVTVSWPAGAAGPTVDKDPIDVPRGAGATVIRWVCGDNVSRLQISGLDGTVFSPAASQGMVPSFSTTDANREAGTYSYTLAATQTSGDSTAGDPRIRNGG
ncbi:MAG: hypothetical protein KBA95_06840 [Acidobacteria bacterium]|nr:hypothetical protein [Acidobacteriota bacterium]